MYITVLHAIFTYLGNINFLGLGLISSSHAGLEFKSPKVQRFIISVLLCAMAIISTCGMESNTISN